MYHRSLALIGILGGVNATACELAPQQASALGGCACREYIYVVQTNEIKYSWRVSFVFFTALRLTQIQRFLTQVVILRYRVPEDR